MGLSYTGISCLLTANVSGYNRVPRPPAKMIPSLQSDFIGFEKNNDKDREDKDSPV